MIDIRDFYGRLLDMLDQHHKLAIATVVEVQGSTPREGGAKMMVMPDGSIHGTIGGGRLEKLVTEEALEAMKKGQGFYKEYDLVGEEEGGIGTECGGISKVLVEVISTPDRLLICGGGHVGLALAKMAAVLGMQVWVVDPREEFSDLERYPDGISVVNASPASDEVAELVSSNTYVVILTHEHQLDKKALGRLVDREAAYIGMIGSKRKVRRIMKELEDEGTGKDKLSKVHAPIGLDIAAETPSEIAISILGEIVNTKRKGVASPISMKELIKDEG